MNPELLEKLAEEAYTAYHEHTKGISVISGDILPGWDKTRPAVKDAWRAAVRQVVSSIS